MSDEDFAALKDDIEVNGQREPVMIFEGMVLDGWHRYRACLDLGLKPQQFTFPEGDDPVAFVKGANLHRRHLTESQRAMIGGRMYAAIRSLAVMQTVPSIESDLPAALSEARVAASPMTRRCSSRSRPPPRP